MGARKETVTHCHFHPTEVIVGVCALCVKERLLILASEQAHRNLIRSIHKAHRGPPIAFALGSLPQHHHKLRKQSSDNARKNSFSGNKELFFSIKFGDDGNRFREKGVSSWSSQEVCNPTSTYCFNKARRKRTMGIVEHTRLTRKIWWRKRVDHLFELMIGKIQLN